MTKITSKQLYQRIHCNKYYWLLCTTTLICLFAATIGHTAVNPHELQINFSFNTEAIPDKQVTGYRLYMEGDLVCETTQTEQQTQSIACTIVCEDGTYAFTLSALFDDNSESPQSAPFLFALVLSIIDPPAAILASSSAAGNAPLAVTFNGTSSTTPNPPIVSYSWTFGDGSLATGETVSHTYSTAGTYHTELTVTDRLGLTDKVNTPIIVLGTAVPNEKPEALISADSTEGNAPLTVAFDGSQSSDPDGSIVRYDWKFGDGTTGIGPTVQHTYTGEAIYTASLQVTDDRGETTTTTQEIISNIAPPENILNFEAGELSIDHKWVKVLFENSFNQPIVVAGPPTFNGSNPVLVRIRNIDREGFEVRLQEWDYLDGSHTLETFSYIVMEKGIHTMDSGMKIEAGSFTGSARFQKFSLLQPSDSLPVILTQVMTENDARAVTGRMRNIGQSTFEYKLQEQETTKNGHPTETIGYIAWEPGKGEIQGLLFEAGHTPEIVNHEWFGLTFETVFPDQPLFIASMQTYEGADTSAVRTQNMSQTVTEIKIEEEQSKDSETGHVDEVVGYLVIGNATATQ